MNLLILLVKKLTRKCMVKNLCVSFFGCWEIDVENVYFMSINTSYDIIVTIFPNN